jgi:26S proteasome regulatory subunit N6
MAAKALEHNFQTATELHPDDAVAVYRDIALGRHGNDADSVKIKEQAIQKLADLYASKKEAAALRSLLTELRPLFGVIPKAKTAKIVRTIIETISKVPDSTDLQVGWVVHCLQA